MWIIAYVNLNYTPTFWGYRVEEKLHLGVKIKGKLALKQCAVEAYGVVGVYIRVFLTSALDE
jgi:hypothetical protein